LNIIKRLIKRLLEDKYTSLFTYIILDNIARDYLCNYGFFAKEEGLATDVYEKDCTMPGTKNFDYKGLELMFCDEHYSLVVSKK